MDAATPPHDWMSTLRKRLSLLCFLLPFFGALPASAASAATYYVSPGGSDSGAGTSAAPFASISKAVSVARRGDSVLVGSGRYAEQVSLSAKQSGVLIRGVGTTRPIVDGGGTRKYGFYFSKADDVTVQNFEITGQTDAGVYAYGANDTVSDNLVHHVGKAGVTTSSGIRVVYGSGARVLRNTVHSIGPGGESMGIYLLQTRDADVDANTVYLVRKEGVRDWMGLDNRIENNRLFLSWVGVAFNFCTGAVASNNYIYDVTEGLDAKHTSHPRVLANWKIDSAHWSRFVHNTVFRSSETSVWIAQSDDPLDYLQVADNIFDESGLTYVRDAPKIRGPHVVVDSNVYAPATPQPYFYKEGWSSAPGLSAWTDYQSALGWERNGKRFDPQLRAPAAGDLDYPDTSPAAAGGLQLGDPLGRQLGARGLTPAAVKWTSYPLTAVDSSSKGTWYTKTHLKDTADGDQASYWLTATDHNEYVTYDLGAPRIFDHVIVTLYAHNDSRNPHGYRFEASNDGVNWHTVLAGTNPDPEGSPYIYELPSPATARYLRYTMVDTTCRSYAPRTKCGPYFVLSDVQVGTIGDPGHSSTLPAPVVRSPGPGATAPRAAGTKVAISSVRLRHRRVRVKLACLGSRGRCRGAIKLYRGKRAMRSRRLARHEFSIAHGRHSTVRLRLGSRGIRALRRARRRASVIAVGRRGARVRRVVILRGARRSSHRRR